MVLQYLLNSESEIDQFGLWAFGNDYKELVGISFMKKWNELHGEVLMLFENGSIIEDIKRMIDLWNKNKLLANKQ